MRRYLTIAVEGFRFMWLLRPRLLRVPGKWLPGLVFTKVVYLKWRLGTVYGTFKEPGSIEERPLRSMLLDLWRDREGAARFLDWSRSMRRMARRR